MPKIYIVNTGVLRNSEEWALQNLAAETSLKIELEREEQKCNSLKIHIENVAQECVNAEDSNCQLRKILADKKAEVQETRQEIDSQKEVINDVCNSDRLQNFDDTLEVISHVANEYEEVKALLSKEIENCRTYHAEIVKMRDEAKDVIDSVLASRKEKEHMIDTIETNVTTLNTLLDDVPDEEIELLRDEIDLCVALKNSWIPLKIEKKIAAQRLNQSIKEEEERRARTEGDVSSQVDERKLQIRNDIVKLNEEMARIISEADGIHDLKEINEEYKRIQEVLKSLKTEFGSSQEYTTTLQTEKQTYERQILEREIDTELHKQHKRMRLIAMNEFEKEWDGSDEMVFKWLERQRQSVQQESLDVSGDIDTLRVEISSLEKELESFDQMLDEDVQVLNDCCESWKKQIDDETAKLVGIRSQDDVVELLEIMFTKSEGGDGDEEFKVDTISIEKLESSTRQFQDRFERETDEMNEIMNAFQKEIDASAIEVEQSELFLETFERDFQCLMEAHHSKEFENWTSKRESAQKVTELNELKKKVVAETAMSERTQDLLGNLERNTIRKEELNSHPSFQVYKDKLETLVAMRKLREKREQESKLFAEKLEQYTEAAD